MFSIFTILKNFFSYPLLKVLEPHPFIKNLSCVLHDYYFLSFSTVLTQSSVIFDKMGEIPGFTDGYVIFKTPEYIKILGQTRIN